MSDRAEFLKRHGWRMETQGLHPRRWSPPFETSYTYDLFQAFQVQEAINAAYERGASNMRHWAFEIAATHSIEGIATAVMELPITPPDEESRDGD